MLSGVETPAPGGAAGAAPQYKNPCTDRSILILRHAFIPLDNARLAHLCGSLDCHLRDIESAFDVTITRRNESFRIEGGKAQAERAVALLQSLYDRAQRPLADDAFQLSLVEAAYDSAGRAIPQAPLAAAGGPAPEVVPAESRSALRTRRADLAGRTPNQHLYLANIQSHDISFGIGPAGTGKTFLAVACAIDALERSSVQRIVLTRPAVEAGEVAPLAFMRGRTLNHAFVILDEAQNTTPEQMKMFLTRIGFGSKCVVTGDVSQIDLPRGQMSGLIDAERVLRRVRGVATTRFSSADVVRHPLVARIVDAYEASRADTV